ncbi:MAG: hypothetical protein ACI8ZB_002752 [Desulforhopalus sp.]|jgi:hypothetical protein
MALQEQLTELNKENIAKFPAEMKNILLGDLIFLGKWLRQHNYN